MYNAVIVVRGKNYREFNFRCCDENNNVVEIEYHSFESLKSGDEQKDLRLISTLLHSWFLGKVPKSDEEIDVAVTKFNGIAQEVHRLLGELDKTHINDFKLSLKDNRIMFKYEKLEFTDVA